MGNQRICRGMGRIEFVAISEELQKLFAAGYNLRIAYNELVKNNKITMSYSSFCGYAKTMYMGGTNTISKTITARPPDLPQKAQKDNIPTNQISGHGKLGQSSPPLFRHDPNPDPEKIFGSGWNKPGS